MNKPSILAHKRFKDLAMLVTAAALLAPGTVQAKRAVRLEPTGTPTFPEAPFRNKPPEAGPVRDVQQPAAQAFTLPSGLQVLLVERRQIPTLSLQFVLPVGSQEDPPGKEGLASVCVDLLTEGTKSLDKIAFSEALADLASSIGSSAGVDQSSLTAAMLERNVDKTLDLVADTLLQPGMRAEDFTRIIRQRKAGLQAQRGNPSALAGRLAASVVYGPQHPFGRVATEASYDHLTIEDCRKQVAERIRPGGAKLYVVGAIDRASLEHKLGERLASWQGSAPVLPPTGAPKPRPGRVFFVDVPGAQQAVVQIMHPGPRRTAPDYEATSVLASILSSGFSSRINMNIREKHGYAYGAGGGFSYSRDAGVFSVAASVRIDTVGPSIREILKEMEAIRAADVTPDELSREKQGAILALPSRWSTGQSIVSTFQGLQYYGLALDEYTRSVPRIQAVDAAKVLAAAKAYVHPEVAQVLVVGDAATVLPQIEALQKDGTLPAGIVRLDTDGKVLTELRK